MEPENENLNFRQNLILKETGDTGRILSVQGEIVKVEFLESGLFSREILELVENPDVKFEVYSALSEKIFILFVLTILKIYTEGPESKEREMFWRCQSEKRS